MSTLTVTVTATAQDFSTFADELGYLTEVFKTPEEIALLPEPVSIQDRLKPNPQSRQAFLEDYFKGVVVGELYKKKAQVIDRQVDDAKEAEKVTLKSGITSAVSVSSVI